MIRSGLRIRAFAALVAFVGSLALPLLSFGHLTFDDDRACDSLELRADQNPRTAVGETRPALPPEHCALCHWLRAVGNARTSGSVNLQAWLESSLPVVLPAPAW